MTQPVTLIRAAANAKAPSPSTWNPGMPMYSPSSTSAKNHGKDELRARDLFYAMWIPDLFIETGRVRRLLEPVLPARSTGPGGLLGRKFEKLYAQYEAEPGRARKTIKAQDLWFAILDAQIETGTPISYTGFANRKSNQQNLGNYQELQPLHRIIEYTSPEK